MLIESVVTSDPVLAWIKAYDIRHSAEARNEICVEMRSGDLYDYLVDVTLVDKSQITAVKHVPGSSADVDECPVVVSGILDDLVLVIDVGIYGVHLLMLLECGESKIGESGRVAC